MVSIMCLHFSMQEEKVIEHTKCQVLFVCALVNL